MPPLLLMPSIRMSAAAWPGMPNTDAGPERKVKMPTVSSFGFCPCCAMAAVEAAKTITPTNSSSRFIAFLPLIYRERYRTRFDLVHGGRRAVREMAGRIGLYRCTRMRHRAGAYAASASGVKLIMPDLSRRSVSVSLDDPGAVIAILEF